MEEASGTIHDILAAEQELERQIAAVETELAAALAAARADEADGCARLEEELRATAADRLAAVRRAAATATRQTLAAAEERARRLDALDDAALVPLLRPLLMRILPGRGP